MATLNKKPRNDGHWLDEEMAEVGKNVKGFNYPKGCSFNR